MTTIRAVTSLSNDTVKHIRSLHIRKYREQSKEFLAEGLKIIISAVEQGRSIRTLVYEAAMRDNAQVKKLRKAMDAKSECLEVNKAVLEKISARDNPQSVIAVFAEAYESLAAVKTGVWVVLEEIHDPGNLGTIIRSADAAGAEGIVLVGKTCDPFSLEAVRASMGSLFNQRLIKVSSDEFLKWRAKFNGQVIGTHLKATQDYREASYKKPLLLVMGSEQAGLSDAMAKACTQLVKIPMKGAADSLNLAVATGIMLFRIF